MGEASRKKRDREKAAMTKRYAVVSEPITCRSDDGTPIHIIQVDADNKVVSDEEDKPWGEYRFLAVLVFTRPEWLKPLSRSHMAGRILDLYVDAEPGGIIEFSDEQWRALKETLEAKDFELPKHYSYQLTPLAYGIIDASEKRPEPQAVEETETSSG